MRLLKNFTGTLLVVALAALSLSCTREAQNTKSLVSLSLPGGNGTLAFDSLTHVSINVTGSGISTPIVVNWDRDNRRATDTTAKTSFEVEIPNGSDRLIQVLAVYSDSSSSSGAMQFYYGDTTQSIPAASSNVNVDVTSVAQGSTIVSGQIQGRYFKSATEGYTSKIDIVYAPPGGKTPMIVERSLMMNGWFQFFGLIGAKLGYRLEDGTYLWGGPIDLTETSFAVSNRVMRVAVPIHLRVENNGGTSTNQQDDPQVYIYGFFGDAAGISSKSICKTSGTPLTTLLKVGTSTPLGVTDDGSPDPTNLFDTNLGSINVRGGVSVGGASPCDTQVNIDANLFSSVLAFTPPMLQNGNDNAAGFRLPFQLPKTTGNGGSSALTSTVVDANNITIAGTLLPGTNSVFDNFTVYKATGLGPNFYYHSSYAPCDALTTTMGYSKVADTPVSGVAYSATLPLTDAEASGGAMFALCPSKGGVPFGPGMWVQASYMRGNSGGCIGCGGSATQLAAVLVGNKVANSVCTPFFIEGRDASNHVASFNGPMTMSFAVDNADTVVYSDSYCTSAITVPYSAYTSSQTFYLKRASTGTGSRNLTVTSNLPTLSQPLNFVDSAGTPFVMARVPTSINAYACYTASYISMLQNGSDTMVANLGGSYNFTLPTTSGLTYYYNSGSPCSTTGSGNVSLGSSSTISSLNFSYSGAAASISLVPVSASPTFSNYTGGSPINVTQPGGAAFVRLAMPPSISAESCVNANLQVLDANFNLTTTPQAVSLNFTFNGSGSLPTNAGFYSDPSCNSPTSAPSVAAANTQSSQVFFRWPTTGSLSIAASITSGPTGMSYSSQSINVGSPTVASIIAYPANGVSFAWPSTFTGYAQPIQKSQPFTITLEARSPLGNLVVGFNDSNPGSSGVNIQDQYSNLTCGSIVWAAGMGSVTCSVPNSPDYFSSIMDQLKTGGGASMYPMFYGTPNIRVSRSADEINTQSYLLSKPFSYYSGVCQPLMFTRGQYTGSYFVSSTVASGMTYTANLTYNTGVTGFYSDASCTSSITQSTLGVGQSANMVYVKMNGTAPSNNLAMQADSVGVSDSGVTGLSFSIGSPPSTFSQYNISMSLNQYYHICSPVMVVRTDANGTAVSAGATDSVTLSSNFASSWYSDAACGTSLASNVVSFSAGESGKIVYIRPDVPNFSSGTVNATNGTQTGTASGINGQP